MILIIRTTLLVFVALTLTACSMQAMAEKRVPADVRAEANAQIDRLIAGNTNFILDAFPEDRNNPDLLAQIDRMRANIPDGEEQSRHIVGVMGSTQQAYSDTQGAIRSGTYNLAYELEFETGYLLVQSAYTLDAGGNCCTLRSINATRSDESPMRDGQVKRARLFKFMAIFFLISSLITAIILVIRVGGRKARDTQMGG